jgi:hypothetical protein
MEVSGQIHAPAVLISRKKPPVPTVQEAGWAPGPRDERIIGYVVCEKGTYI